MANYFVQNGASADADQDARRYEVETLADGRYRMVTPQGRELLIEAFEPEAARVHMLIDGQSFDAAIHEVEGRQHVQLNAEFHAFEVLNERQKRMSAAGVGARAAGGPDLVSPMAGKVVALACAEGDAIEEGQCVIIVEAMKMENDLKAHISGTVAKIHVSQGDAVEVGDVLISIEPA